MKKYFLPIALAFAIVCFSPAAANTQNDKSASSQTRPKIGLVLAGGGAKGSAHIGVLKYLEEKGIPIDYIAGTSMGSIIGGLYALGYSPSQLDSIIKAVDWSYYLSNKAERDDRSYMSNYYGDRYPLSINFGMKEQQQMASDYLTRSNAEELRKRGELVNEKSGSAFSRSISSGLVSGNNLVNLFNDLCIGYQDSIDFNKLPIPYACVATDLLGGKEYVIRNGQIAYAMRSSMAIPVFFAPVEYQGRLLVDGGMVNNFPTDVCKAMGADIIIGVELNEGFRANKDDINSMPGLLGQLFKIVTSGRNADNRKLCDVYIRPNVSGYGMMSFNAESVDSLVEKGYVAAREFEGAIDSIKLVEGKATKKLKAVRAHTINETKLKIMSVQAEGLEEDEEEWLRKKWDIGIGKEISAEELHSKIAKYKGTGMFKAIDYYISDADGGQTLLLKFTKRPENTFRMGLWADSEEAVALGINTSFRDNAFSGFKGNVNLRISCNPYAEGTVTYSIPQLFDINFSGRIRYSKQYLSELITSRLVSSQAKLYLSNYYSRHSDINGGLMYEVNSEKELLYLQFSGRSQGKYRSASVFADYSYDRRNHAWAPTKGLRFNVEGRFRFWTDYIDIYSGDKVNPLPSLSASAQWSFTPGKGLFTFTPQAYMRYMFNDNITPEETHQVGGWEPGRFADIHMPFIGTTGTEMLSGKYAAIARLDARWNIASVHYLSAVCNYLVSQMHNYVGAAVKYTFGTPVGPLSLDVHWSDIGISSKWGIGVSFGCYF